jgi:hypothetical protein
MPDISMCLNDACPSHTSCYRFMAVPMPSWQSYSQFAPSEDDERCGSFWQIEPGQRIRSTTTTRETL